MLFAGIALVVWSGWQNLRQRRSAMQEQQNRRVDLIPDSQSAAAGESQLRGKPAPAFTLLEMPWLQEFSLKYASDGFQVVGVTYDSEVGKDVIARDTQRLGVTYPILLSTPKAEKDYLSNTEALPMSFYVDKTGKVIEITAGLGSKDELEAMVKETIAAGGN